MTRKWLVHGVAQCDDCDWYEADYLTVQRKASAHARRTGHRVRAELGYAVEYGSRTTQNTEAGEGDD